MRVPRRIIPPVSLPGKPVLSSEGYSTLGLDPSSLLLSLGSSESRISPYLTGVLEPPGWLYFFVLSFQVHLDNAIVTTHHGYDFRDIFLIAKHRPGEVTHDHTIKIPTDAGTTNRAV